MTSAATKGRSVVRWSTDAALTSPSGSRATRPGVAGSEPIQTIANTSHEMSSHRSSVPLSWPDLRP
jgi:hypothetical protein